MSTTSMENGHLVEILDESVEARTGPESAAATAQSSGLYQWAITDPSSLFVGELEGLSLVSDGRGSQSVDAELDGAGMPPATAFGVKETLRIDVDGYYPQMTVSGTRVLSATNQVHWIAALAKTGTNRWAGTIWYKYGDTAALPHTNVVVRTWPTSGHVGQRATVRFSGGGGAPHLRRYRWERAAFRPVIVEQDATTDSNPVTSIGTCAHPNRPASLPCEQLTLQTLYRRAGFTAQQSTGSGPVPLTMAGADALWSMAEMHDAMQVYWAHFANAPQWALWVFWAAMSDWGDNLGGIMFDDIGPNHRQGTAIFTESFIATPPPNDLDPAAWTARMRFWTAAHEMGHAFNLAHSWQKSMGTPWIPLLDEPEARSPMNYPFAVAGGEAAFFADFAYRFSDQELLFLRHAPGVFVQMGNADWFDHHGFEQLPGRPSPTLRLEVRANRPRPTFAFLEPVTLELKLTNVGAQPCAIDQHALTPHNLTVVIKQQGRAARQWAPYAKLCLESDLTLLRPGESLYAPLRLFAGTNGWDVSEPGSYDVQVAYESGGQHAVSDPLRLRIAAPRSWDEEDLATEVFTEEVGRALIFGGTRVMQDAQDTLEAVVERLPGTRAAVHASVALALPAAKDFKVLELPAGRPNVTAAHEAGGRIVAAPARPDAAAAGLLGALGDDAQVAAETLGHITYKRQVDRTSAFLDANGDAAAAAQAQWTMLDVLSSRRVLPSVQDEIDARARGYEAAAPQPRSRRHTPAD